jgi:hypothetical protein
MAKPASDQTAREKDVANTLASLRIENLSPSDSLKLGLQEYIEGKKTTEDLLSEVKAKYVALRR